jgi:hypothetical protein
MRRLSRNGQENADCHGQAADWAYSAHKKYSWDWFLDDNLRDELNLLRDPKTGKT